jgi:hypothetical protein
VTLILLSSIKISAQNKVEYNPATFEVVKYKGTIGKYPITICNYYYNYETDVEIFLSPGGIYFRKRLFKLDPYLDLFLSFQEVKSYLKQSFKQTLKLP